MIRTESDLGTGWTEPSIENGAGSNGARRELDIHPDRDPAPLLGDGEIVDVVCVDYTIRPIYKGEQTLELHCQVLEGGEKRVTQTADGRSVPMDLSCYFRLPARRGGSRTIVSRNSRFYRAWTLVNGGRRPSRRDRMTPDLFLRRLLRARTKVVKTDSMGKKLPEDVWYSVIAEFIQ